MSITTSQLVYPVLAPCLWPPTTLVKGANPRDGVSWNSSCLVRALDITHQFPRLHEAILFEMHEEAISSHGFLYANRMSARPFNCGHHDACASCALSEWFGRQ